MIVASAEITLAAAVASPAGTVNVPYPTGYAQADFIGSFASATAYLLLNDNDRFEEADDEFDISYGASHATVTNKVGYTWPIGTRLMVGMARVDSSNYDGPVHAAIANIPTAEGPMTTVEREAFNSVLGALRSAGIVAA